MMVLLESNAEISEKNKLTIEEKIYKVYIDFQDELQLDIKVGEEYLDDLNKWFDSFDEKNIHSNIGFTKMKSPTTD